MSIYRLIQKRPQDGKCHWILIRAESEKRARELAAQPEMYDLYDQMTWDTENADCEWVDPYGYE